MITAQEVIENLDLQELTPEEAYSWIFQLGEKGSDYIQRKNQDNNEFKANPIGYFKYDDREHGEYRILFKDTFFEELKKLQSADFAIINGLTYFGRKNLSEHSSKMFAMIFDLDGVGVTQVASLLHQGEIGFLPSPNIIACSGHGLHLYYLFETPIDLYPNTKVYLKELKYWLTTWRIWNAFTSTEKRQLQGISQPFRVIGGKTKIEGTVVRAFKVRPERWTLKELDSYVPEGELNISPDRIYRESRYTLEEARKRYPEWYASLGEKREKGHWTTKRDLYDWWKRQIKEEKIELGHRYFSIMALAIYGIKSGITKEEVEEDAYSFVPFLSKIGEKEGKPFSKDDAKSALECFDARYVRFPRADIEKLCGVRIDKNKRNGRTQTAHLARARAVQDLDYPNGEWRGRKSKEAEVLQWKEKNPEGSKTRCHKETGLSRTTIDKYWGL